MTKKIYVVIGESGEYSDHSEWLVAAFLSETKAYQHAETCAADLVRMFEEGRDSKGRYDGRVDGWDCRSLDKDWNDGVKYYVVFVDLLDAT